MAVDKPDVTLSSALEAVRLFHDIYRGRSRSLVRFVSSILDAYVGTDYAVQEGQADQILMDLARVVVSQVGSPETKMRNVALCERLTEALNSDGNLASISARLSREDLARLRDMTDFVMRLGILQFDRVSTAIHVYAHMYDSGILLEDSTGLARGRNTPSIKNEAVPGTIQGFYDAHAVISKSFQEKSIPSSNGPGF